MLQQQVQPQKKQKVQLQQQQHGSSSSSSSKGSRKRHVAKQLQKSDLKILTLGTSLFGYFLMIFDNVYRIYRRSEIAGTSEKSKSKILDLDLAHHVSALARRTYVRALGDEQCKNKSSRSSREAKEAAACDI